MVRRNAPLCPGGIRSSTGDCRVRLETRRQFPLLLRPSGVRDDWDDDLAQRPSCTRSNRPAPRRCWISTADRMWHRRRGLRTCRRRDAGLDHLLGIDSGECGNRSTHRCRNHTVLVAAGLSAASPQWCGYVPQMAHSHTTAAGTYNRGSTGSDSSASTANTAWWMRYNGSPRTDRSNASMPSAYSRSAIDCLCPTFRLRSAVSRLGSV